MEFSYKEGYSLKKWKYVSIAVVIIAFISANLYLLFKEDSKAERIAYINEWRVVKKGDITKTFDTKGVTKTEQEYYVYYDENRGALSSLLVQEGDTVSEGTALFTYGTLQLDDERAELESNIMQLENEIASIENQLSELKGIVVSMPSNSVSTDSAEVNVEVNVDVSPIAENDVEIAIVETEAELRKLEAKLLNYEEQLARLDGKQNDLTVRSAFEGQVIAVKANSANPIVTIASPVLEVKGVLTEKQMKKIAEEQTVTMYSSLHKKTYTGTVKSINAYPQEAVSVDEETTYSFIVQFDELNEELLVGTKVDMTVVVGEVMDVPVVSSESTFKSGKKTNVYQLSSKGTVETKTISKGLSFEGIYEVKEGLETGDIIVKDPSSVNVVGAGYITPMKKTTIQKQALKQMSKRQIAKYTLLGML